MFYIGFDQPGDASVLCLKTGEAPSPGPGELLVRVRAAALNRADTIQRQGIYVPPPGQSQILGVELSGEVAGLGEGVSDWQIGDRVFGLTNGGAYAEYCLLHASMAVAVPPGMSHVQAAAIPEAYFTSHETLVELGGLKAGQTVLVHAGASGIGTGALQIIQTLGGHSFFTVGSSAKMEACQSLGGNVGINYKTQDFVAEVLSQTEGRGVDLILDFIGGPYLERNLAALAVGGTLLTVGILGGIESRIDVLQLIMRRLQIKGFSMRSQSQEAKAGIVARFRQHWLTRLSEGSVVPVVHQTYPIGEAIQAHLDLEANLNVGKLILTLD